MIITLKDGSTKEYSEPKSIIEIAADISEGLARMACAGEVNGDLNDGFRFGVLFGTSIFQCDDHLLYLFLCIFFLKRICGITVPSYISMWLLAI